MRSLQRSRYADDLGPCEGRIWFNTAHQGPPPRVAFQAAHQALEQKTRPHELRDAEFVETPRGLREVLGRLIPANADDTILGNRTSYGLDLLAHGIRWRPGDEVLLVREIFPWFILREQGVKVRIREPRGPVIAAETLAQEISPQTRLFCTAWVNSFTGRSIDIDSLGGVCRLHGITCNNAECFKHLWRNVDDSASQQAPQLARAAPHHKRTDHSQTLRRRFVAATLADKADQLFPAELLQIVSRLAGP